MFLHYVLDKWLEKTFPNITFVRYADDVVIHCISEAQSLYVLKAIKQRLANCCLQLSEEKTKITYCKDYRRDAENNYPKKFYFLGFSFKPMSKPSNKGGTFLGFNCQKSVKSRTKIIDGGKQQNFHRQTQWSRALIAEKLNPQIRGIINYYATIEKESVRKLFRHLDVRIAKWVKNKYKDIKNSYLKANDWIRSLKENYPTLLYHWQLK